MATLRTQFARTVTELGGIDEELVVVVGDISHGIFTEFAASQPSRYYNIGICEPSMVSMCAGLNKVGLNPVIHTIAPFLIDRSFEQIKLDFEYQGLSGNFVSVGGTFDYSQLGCSHHSYMDVALMRSLPSAQIFMPGSPTEFDECFRENYQKPGIKYFRLTENSHGHSGVKTYNQGHIVRRGSDLTIVTSGASLADVDSACETLVQKGIDVELIYLCKVSPLDHTLIRKSVSTTGNLLVVSELSQSAGLSQIVLEGLPISNLREFRSCEAQDMVRDYGTYTELRQAASISTKNIITIAVEMLGK